VNKKVITFFEVKQDVSSVLPQLGNVEELVFDYINNRGAATESSIIHSERDFSPSQIRSAIGSLLGKGLIERRNVTVEPDE
jgi:hypothetical protein